jgi:hypothetical protein
VMRAYSMPRLWLRRQGQKARNSKQELALPLDTA